MTIKPKKKTAAPKAVKRSKIDAAAVAICKRVYASGKCVCEKSKKPVCANMVDAARSAACVIAGYSQIDRLAKEPA